MRIILLKQGEAATIIRRDGKVDVAYSGPASFPSVCAHLSAFLMTSTDPEMVLIRHKILSKATGQDYNLPPLQGDIN